MSPTKTTAQRVTVIERQIDGPEDIELQRPRTRKLVYRLVLPECTVAKGLLFYIPGFGEDGQESYLKNLTDGLASDHDYAVVTVDYHCLHSRQTTGARLMLTFSGEETVIGLCKLYGIAYDPKLGLENLQALGEVCHKTQIPAMLVPPDGEYQNFGVLQALDHLAVLNDILNSPEASRFDTHNIVLAGSSHGGYIAHLMAKFAPNTINVIIDNSSYVQTPMYFIGVEPETYLSVGTITLACNVPTPWQFTNPHNCTYFGLPQLLIRHTAYPAHLQTLKNTADRLPEIFAFNTVTDAISPIAPKRLQHQHYQAISGQYDLLEITDKHLDGRLFKTLDHGMNASMKGLIGETLAKIKTRSTKLDRDRQTVLNFDCIEKTYTISHTSNGVQLSLT